jgi:hypothetical protein
MTSGLMKPSRKSVLYCTTDDKLLHQCCGASAPRDTCCLPLRGYRKYMRSVRSEAPYLPSNVEFVAVNNGEALSGEC